MLKNLTIGFLGLLLASSLGVASAAASPTVVQSKSSGLTTSITNVTLTNPVTAGNWIVYALTTVGSSPFNCLSSDNQGHIDADFGYTGLRYASSLGTIWQYIKVSTSGTYTLTVQRPSAATNGAVHVFEVSGVDPTTFLDITGVGTSGATANPTGTFGVTTTRPNDLLLGIVAVNSSTAVITPTTPAGTTALVSNNKVGSLTSSIFGYTATTTRRYTVAGTLNTSRSWRLSAIAIRGVATTTPVAAPVNTVRPAISVVDNGSFLALTTTQGTWLNNPTQFTYNWLRNGVIIAGATAATYNTTLGDQGTSVASVVTAVNAAGTVSATSTAIAVPFATSTPAPTVSLVASPTSITAGQSSTLTWTSTNATSCTSNGAWTGARAVSGTLVVTPSTTSTYSLNCIGSGGAATGTAVITVTPAGTSTPGNPTLGAHSLKFHFLSGGIAGPLQTAAMTTQPTGSTMVVLLAHGFFPHLQAPTDNKGNTYTQQGTFHEYNVWPNQGSAIYTAQNAIGGAGHIVQANKDNHDEVTLAAVEVKNGGVIQDVKWNQVAAGGTLTSQSVTTTGPATIIAVWEGDDGSGTNATVVPNNGFVVADSHTLSQGTMQAVVATKDVTTAGTYNVTWNTTPTQGAMMWMIVVQKSGAATSTVPAPTVSLTASPTSITPGQSSTLTWSSTNATSCTGSGAWTGAAAISGTLSVQPTVTSTYTLTCAGAGGTGSSSATVTVSSGTSTGTTPTTGAHGLAWHVIQGSTGPTLSLPAMTTTPGSTFIVAQGRGSIFKLKTPTDNKGNVFTQIGPVGEYIRWPTQGGVVHASHIANNAGANHIISVEDSDIWDEVTMEGVEVKNGGVIQDVKWNQVLNSPTQTSLNVTTTGPATLVAFWIGDDGSSVPANPIPNNGFVIQDGQPRSNSAIAIFSATKDVTTAGTYNVTWTASPLQGAMLWLMAVQKQ